MQKEAQIVKIILGGALGRKFGKEWNLRVGSVAEAVQAIDVNTGGKFRGHLYKEGNKKFYKIALGRKDNLLDKEELCNPSGKNDIYILPVIKGREKGLTKILAAVAIAAVTYFTFGAGGFFANAALATAGYSAAASLAIGGIVQLLTPVPNFNQSPSQDSSRGSNIFAGNAASASQGEGVALVYGRALVAPTPVCLSFSAVDQLNVGSDSYATQEYDIEYGDGGVVNYIPRAPNPDDNVPS
jgi:predicted phage tail protein